jgi:mannose-6-phosphate isomerase-like protein (cupin superfamily)
VSEVRQQAPRVVREFREPVVVRRSDATRFLWGDEESHLVSDLVYGRGLQISSLIYHLRPGEYFRGSSTWKPLYDQHRVYYVVSGTLAIHDPESGEIATAVAGEAISWRGTRYHFGYNFGTEETFVLDWYAPPERAIDVPEVAVSAAKRDLGELRPGQIEFLEAWPDRLSEARAASRAGGVVTVRPADALHLIHGAASPYLVEILASSDALTFGTFSLRPALLTEPESHPGDEVVFALEGGLHIHLPESHDWFELEPLDCAFIPGGTRHRYCNHGAATNRAAFCVAPKYR